MLGQEDYDKAYAHVSKWEGGESNHPADRGGHTKYGITQRFLDAHDIKNNVGDLNGARAKEIYYDYIWRPCKYAFIEDLKVATKIFDMNVNMGPTQAHKLAQRAVNALRDEDIKVDGILGKETLAAINSANGLVLLNSLRVQCKIFYENIVAGDETQRVFLDGWLRRARD